VRQVKWIFVAVKSPIDPGNSLYPFFSSLEICLSCIRIQITVCIWRVARVNWGFDGHKYPFYLPHYASASKIAFATTSNASIADIILTRNFLICRRYLFFPIIFLIDAVEYQYEGCDSIYKICSPRYSWNTANVGVKHQPINQYGGLFTLLLLITYRQNTLRK
jgi:hypothetical protein